MKNVKTLSLGIAMLIGLSTKAQEKIVTDLISEIKEAKFVQTEVEISPVKVSSNFVKTDSSPPSLRIVCIKSIQERNEPLYILDGRLINAKQFSKVNPNDIQDIKVLKGTEATSIYGNQGKNGVIIITTKKNSQNNNDE
ncbi:TonB-dependent receptor plug domain-containing protein [Flavobacterium saccharophilum]|uniref:TonB-dependent outer membrane receptor, SusC/RagA subfamily, signature region n=1 Tax=Flavobacterium saccharophilum TaxID=29534 RepID=A0A1M7GX93_9FLAO|nr:TonB-dependent receptor plug domain-containing protein [Flavobacterium saccharophilum]SHM20733.1 TonB-dependent outer membrane receptor, SusC/RagA subfamily, signature region [Flavobacterium saccharophilum]